MTRLSRKHIFLIGSLIIVLWYCIDHVGFLMKSEETIGTVVGDSVYKVRMKRTIQNFHHPVVQFSDSARQYDLVSTGFSRLKNNTECEVIFDPGKPDSAYVYSFAGYWAWGLCCAGVGILAVFIAVYSLLGADTKLILSRKRIYLEKNESYEKDL